MTASTARDTSDNGAPPAQTAYKRDLLPSPEELIRQRNLPVGKRPTLQEIADRYGVSRQAVHKRMDKWKKQQQQQG